MYLYFVKNSYEEERAEHIRNIERTNFSDYLKPYIAVFKTIDKQKSDNAKAQLTELFGDLLLNNSPQMKVYRLGLD
jgi:hypothetical protein